MGYSVFWLLAASVGVAHAGQIAVAPPAVRAPAPASARPLHVYLDCWECDIEYVQQHIVFVEYVRDRAAADLHVLVTTQPTGGGGTSWTIHVIGLNRFHQRNLTMAYYTPQSATSDDRRKEFARRFRLALAGYAADTPVARDLAVTYTPATAASGDTGRADTGASDPWGGWLFRIGGSGNGSGETATRSLSYHGSFSASRVTPGLKLNVSMSTSATRRRFTLADGREIRTTSDAWNVSHTTVKSLGRRVAAGVRVAASHSSFDNRDRLVSIYPGIEFNVFPYDDVERRRLTLWYEAGPNYYRHSELTIFDKLEEMVPMQQLDVRLSLRQPWGSTGISTTISQHLNDRNRYNASVFGDADVRVFKGFSFNMFAYYSRIRDQISLPKQGATPEEILLQLRQLETNYSYSVGMGFSYSFGSVFTSIVNPRFSGTNFIY
jgi:hypothetical protein